MTPNPQNADKFDVEEVERELKDISPWPWESRYDGFNFVTIRDNEYKELQRFYEEDGEYPQKDIQFIAQAPQRLAAAVKRIRELESDLATTKGVLNFYKGIIEKCFTTGMTEKEILNELKSSDKE